MNVLNMDCRIGLPMFYPDNYFDSVVTDPPYELGFMGKKWDSTGVAFDPATWTHLLRVAKPGAYMLVFGGSRTYHRITCAIEDAGWEIRDCIMWIYGSGFPKSHNISLALDAAAGVKPDKIQRIRSDGVSTGHSGASFNASDVAMQYGKPITTIAQQWHGFGTALKPAHEPIIMARKPPIGTIAANVTQWGVGGLNIDGCRIPGTTDIGRWPANVIHDGSDEVLAKFPDSGSAARFFYCAKASRKDRDEGLEGIALTVADTQHKRPRSELDDPRRAGVTPRANSHPTVKPTDLMRYLCRLVTPNGGTILDPFAGSGSTGKAASLERFQFVGFESDSEYCEIANRRAG